MMNINFTTHWTPFVKESFRQSLNLYYPDKPLEDLKLSRLFKAVKGFARGLENEKDRHYTHYAISRKSIDLCYADLPYLTEVTKFVKIIGFRNQNELVVYFYPRSRTHQRRDEELFNLSKKAFMISPVDVETKVYRYRVVSLFESKLEKKERGDFSAHFNHLVKFSIRNRDVKTLLPVYHALKIAPSPQATVFEKFYLFSQGVETDLISLKESLLSKNKRDISKEMIKWCFSMIKVIKELHERKIYHGWIALSSFQEMPSSGEREVRLLPSGYTVEFRGKKDRVISYDKPPLLLGYEAIKQMIQDDEFKRSIEGLPGDVWALGCALHHWILGDYPAFALFASMAPELNARCALLRTKIDRDSDEEVENGSGLTPALATSLKVSVKDLRGDWNKSIAGMDSLSPSPTEKRHLHKKPTFRATNSFLDELDALDAIIQQAHSALSRMDREDSEAGHPEIIEIEKHFLNKKAAFTTSDSFLDDLKSLGSIIQQAHSALARIEMEEIGTQMETGHITCVKKLHEIVTRLSSGVFELLLREDIEMRCKENKVLKEQYQTVSKQAIAFNNLFLKELELAEIKMSEMQESSDPLISLLQKMLHPDPTKRITAKKALAFLKKHYPQN